MTKPKSLLLKLCPFCGSRPKIVEKEHFGKHYGYICSNNDCIANETAWRYKTIKEAINAWNKRWHNEKA